jgi:hypothetical protein
VRDATTRFLGVVFAGSPQTVSPAQLRGSLVGSGSPPFSVEIGD